MQKLVDKVIALCEEFLIAKDKEDAANHISFYMLEISERDSDWAWTSELSSAKDFLSNLNKYKMNSDLDGKVKDIIKRLKDSR